MNKPNRINISFALACLLTAFPMLLAASSKSTRRELVLWDQLPISTQESIEVELLEPEFKSDTETLKMNEHQFMEWFFDLAPGQKVEIPFSFSVTVPQGRSIDSLD